MALERIVPLGDAAALAYFADEAGALRFAAGVRSKRWPWLVDVVLAYRSVGVYYELEQVGYDEVEQLLRDEVGAESSQEMPEGPLHIIPCCYELALDLERVAEQTRLAVERVVELHSGAVYTVYAIGFCPGFPYLGYLPAELTGVPRLQSPRLRVEAGSVGLTGRQTGIYTEERPGGWNIVGRTPLQLVDVPTGYFPLRTGDRVRFEPIDRAMFESLKGRRLG